MKRSTEKRRQHICTTEITIGDLWKNETSGLPCLTNIYFAAMKAPGKARADTEKRYLFDKIRK